MSFEAFQHAAPTSWETFEDLCRSLFAEIWVCPTAQKNGRRGDAQHGVDVWGRLPNGDWAGVQCKGKDNYAEKEVTPKELLKEVEKALTFSPNLAQWILVTSGPKRSDVEALARDITEKHRAQGLFEVHAMGWDDLCQLIGRYDEVMERHFPDVAPRTRQMALQVADIHGILTGSAGVRLHDLLGGVAKPPIAPPPFPTADAEWVRRVLGEKSAALMAWPTTTGGRWLDRPELGTMLDHLARSPAPPLVLLGPPGSGKSALMARLGAELKAAGTTLLAIKADALPRHIASVEQLDAEFELPEPLDRCLRRLAEDGRVVLLIDQLDALADLMDVHGGRLGALLALVARIRNQADIRIILSCRDFEYRADARLSALDAEPVRLSLPPWEAVKPLLEERGLSTGRWHDEFREVLRTPQHLEIFLRHLLQFGGTADYRSYHEMLEDVFQRRVLAGATGAADAAALHAIASAVVTEEELWVPVPRLDAHADALARLEGAGFLVREGLRIGFRHQTLFDFVRARAFVANGESVTAYALARQDTIFARPAVWSALSYLRASDRASYERQLQELWSRSDLRLHLRWMLRDLIARQPEPTDLEFRLLLPMVTATEEAPRALRAMSGSAGWFDRLQLRLPTMMRGPDALGFPCAAFLRSVIAERPAAVVTLVSGQWAASDQAQRAAWVMEGLTSWTDEAVDFVEQIAAAAESYSLMSLAKAIGQSHPQRIPGIVLRRLEVVLAHSEQLPNPAQALERFLSDPSGFYGIGPLFQLDPATTVRGLWPCFSAMAERTVRAYGREGNYRPGSEALLNPIGSRSDGANHPGPAFARAVAAWARAEPDAFLEHVRTVEATDLEELHLLLATGLQEIGAERPVAVLDYLIGDPRRLRLGDHQDPRSATIGLMTAATPHLGEPELRRLVSFIRTTLAPKDLAMFGSRRLETSKWQREDTLRIIEAVPVSARPRWLSRWIEEEDRALPGERPREPEIRIMRGTAIPMSALSMGKAKDRDILRFLSGHDDQSGWGSVFASHRGRSVEASRVFAEFAKEHPRRAVRLIGRLAPGRQERPVGYALDALAERDVLPPGDVVSLVFELDGRGFRSTVFREGAAMALARAATALKGLDDHICTVLEGWLGEWEPPATTTTDEQADTTSSGAREPQPILWDSTRLVVLPGGNYPVLRALELGLMAREQPEADRWLAILERHALRRENPKVWDSLADDLRFLWHADRVRAVSFIDSLIRQRPELSNSTHGVRLLAWTHSWLPAEIVERQIAEWRGAGWEHGPQAAGEIAALRAIVDPSSQPAVAIIEEVLSGTDRAQAGTSGFLLGVANSVAALWRDDKFRAAATFWLERITPFVDRALASALRRLLPIAEDLTTDPATERLLRAWLGSSALLAADSHFLPNLLKTGLRDGIDADLVAQVALGMLRAASDELGNVSSRWATSAPTLFELATALQRIASTRLKGTELFEALLLADAHGIDEEMGRFDRNRFG